MSFLADLTWLFRSYYELAAASLRFKFPNPGPLDGITSTTKNILTMRDCSFQYPGSARPQIAGASLKLCLASRVGVTGVNGAGKTTLIKMVVRETEPQSGEVRGWRCGAVRCTEPRCAASFLFLPFVLSLMFIVCCR